MTPIKYAFNGRFVVRKQTGQERFASELLREVDKICRKDEFELVVPEYAEHIPEYQNIKVVKYGRVKGHFWEQISFYRYLRKHHLVSVNLTTTCPLLSAGIVCIHDAADFEIRDLLAQTWYGRIAAYWHDCMIYAGKRSRFPILTVSNYSKERFCHYLHVPEQKIRVISNAWQHFERVTEDDSVFGKLPAAYQKGGFFMALGSLTPQKNLIWVKEVAKRNPQKIFLIVGSAEGFTKHGAEELRLENVHFTGYLSDGEIKALMKACRAFVHPAVYEGFGIPPLEALSCGAELIVSTASCLPEIYQRSAHFIDPHDYDVDLDKLLAEPIEPASAVLERYSWAREAGKLLQLLRENV
jgi:glycosyltransferase involved in cell wall biosynthesis